MPPVLDEVRLAHAAAAGDGHAFARLYDAYEARIFTFCSRLCGNPEDAADATQDAFVKVLQRLPKLEGRDLNFGAYLFTAARNASYDVIGKRKKADAVDEIPEYGASAFMADDRAVAAENPEQAAMLGSLQAAVQAANARLPERQREVLALRELEELSYDEIAEIMDMNRNSVAQLISRARIKLREELQGSALVSVAAATAECERALPLIAMRQDGQLTSGADRDWLTEHLTGCETCKVSVEAMEEAGLSYRAWAPIVPLLWLRDAAIAKAAESVGADWSEVAAEGRTTGDGGAGGGGAGAGGASAGAGGPTAALASAGDARRRRARRGAAAMAGAVMILLLGVSLVTGDDDVQPAKETVPPTTAAQGAPQVTATETTTQAVLTTPGKKKKATTKSGKTVEVPVAAPLTTPTVDSDPVPVAPKATTKPKSRPKGGDGVSGKGGGGGNAPLGQGAPPLTGTTTQAQPPPTTTAEQPPPPPPTTTTTAPPAQCRPGDRVCCRQNPNDPNCVRGAAVGPDRRAYRP